MRPVRANVLLIGLFASIGVAAQDFPSKPVRVIAASPAGGPVDFTIRALTEKLSAGTGQPWVIDNRGGASGLLAGEAVAKAAADGHTLLVTSNTFVITPSLFQKLPYDVFRDFAPVGVIAAAANVLVIHPDRGVKTLADFIALAKRGSVDYGSPAVASAAHLTAELFARTAGISLNHIPFKGPQQAMTETLAGRVTATFAGVSNAVGHARAGRVVALAIADSKRSALLPDVPTFAEQGLAGLDLTFWIGVLAPAGTPPAVVDRLNTLLNTTLRAPDVVERYAKSGFEPLPGTAQRLTLLMQREHPIYAKIVADAGIKPE
jgi:tripartite-type tricarboxylate transporter receptor subunit TctC